jgi:hypothetical protein
MWCLPCKHFPHFRKLPRSICYIIIKINNIMEIAYITELNSENLEILKKRYTLIDVYAGLVWTV